MLVLFHCEQLVKNVDSVSEMIRCRKWPKGNHKCLTQVVPNVSKWRASNISITFSEHLSVLPRREEESTDYEGGSVCPRKWMAVIVPWLVKMNVILRKIMSRNRRSRNSKSQITDVSLSFNFYRIDGGSWGFFLTLMLPLLSLPPVIKRCFPSSHIQTNSGILSIFFGMVSRLNNWADVCLRSW